MEESITRLINFISENAKIREVKISFKNIKHLIAKPSMISLQTETIFHDQSFNIVFEASLSNREPHNKLKLGLCKMFNVELFAQTLFSQNLL